MSFTLTTNYSWKKPDVGSESGTWGGDVNTNYDNQDATVFAVSGVANAALPKAGGTVTGLVNQFTETVKRVDKGSVGGAQTLDLSTAQYFTVTQTSQITWTISNPPATANAAFPLVIRYTNGGTGGQPIWPASCKFPSGTAPVLTTSGVDLIAFISDDAGTTYRMAGLQKDVR